MCQRGGGQGGHVPPQILADQKAPPAGGGAPHYYVPPQIFRLWHMPEFMRSDLTKKVTLYQSTSLVRIKYVFATLRKIPP